MILKWSWIALFVLLADQASKFVAFAELKNSDIVLTPFLNLVLAFNRGAAFGFLSNAGGWQNTFFVVVAIIVSVAIVAMLRQLKPGQAHVAVALMLVLGGAIGNVIDRLRLGYVIDFIDFHVQGWHWYTFNIADAAITLGAIILALDALGLMGRQRSN